MEKTQTNPGRVDRRIDRGLTLPRAGSAAAPVLSYLTPAEFALHQTRHQGRLLGAVAFGTQPANLAAPDCPYARIEMPVLNGESMFEVWTSAEPVVREATSELDSARSEDIMFGCVQVKLDCRLDAASNLAYTRIFDFIDSRGYGHLLRVWNYFPQINGDADGLERYARFNVGRHDAFAVKGREIGTYSPAACALGSGGTHLIVYFLAAKHAGQRVENPRQTSAYHYPPQYGPRSPSFARAMLMQSVDKPLLFVSGTASIVGHETLHAGDARAQASETVANLLAVIGEAQRAGFDAASADANLLLKVYLRHPRDLAMLRECLTQAFGPATNALYLQADVCRADLLLEVEAVYQNAPALAN